MLFQILKPKNPEQEKQLSDFKLKLSEYSDDITYNDKRPKYISVEMSVNDDINKDELDKFINKLYIGHLPK